MRIVQQNHTGVIKQRNRFDQTPSPLSPINNDQVVAITAIRLICDVVV